MDSSELCSKDPLLYNQVKNVQYEENIKNAEKAEEIHEKHNCIGFEENIVLAVKECFFEDEIRCILIKKSKNGRKVKYHNRSCSNVAAVNKKVCERCDEWFTCLSAGLSSFSENISKNSKNYTENNTSVRPNQVKTESSLKNEDEEDDWIPGKPLDHPDSDLEENERKIVKRKEKKFSNKSLADEFKVEGGWICKVEGCGDILSQRRAWVKHVRSHTGKSKCKLCGAVVTKLAQHIKRRHPDEADKGIDSLNEETDKRERKPYTRTKPYNWEKETDANYEEDKNELGHFVCRYGECGKTFETKKTYLKHIFLTHEGGVDSKKKKICDICGNLITANNMRQHVRTVHTHKDQKNFACEHCGKEFKYKSELVIHLTHHTGEMNFACSGCAKRFRRAAEARICEKGHRGIFSFKCHMCDYKTNKKNHLDRHIESHLKATPYICPICGFKSGRKDNLKQHVEKRHCNASTTIKQLEDLYPDMYKIHETSEAASIAKTEALAENFARLHDDDELQEEDSLRMNNISDAANTHVNDGSSGPAGAQFKLEVDETNARGASVPYSDQKYMQNEVGMVGQVGSFSLSHSMASENSVKYGINDQESSRDNMEQKYITTNQHEINQAKQNDLLGYRQNERNSFQDQREGDSLAQGKNRLQEQLVAKQVETDVFVYRQNQQQDRITTQDQRDSSFLEQQRERMIGIADQRRRDHRQRLMIEQRERDRERLAAQLQIQLQERISQEQRERDNHQSQQQVNNGEQGNNSSSLAEMYHRIRSLE